MKISYNWLKDYVDVNMDPKKLASMLTMAGSNVASCENAGGDYIFDFEITANRPDCLSVLGIAREAAALLGKNLKVPLQLRESRKTRSKSDKTPAVKPALKATDLCFRYTARIIKDVEVGPSPDWLKDRIISAGLRPVNNIVDITNFVLLETGQPMHAFNLDRIKGGISVRRAEKGEKLVTIDNVPRTCENETLVIADERGPIAIAGVMGGLDTEVNKMTKNILLESAFFNPVSVRKTSRVFGLSSESSYRFERKIDNAMVLKASDRAAALIRDIAGGKIASLSDVGNKKAYSRTIAFDVKKSNKILGVSVEKKQTARILRSLGFTVKDEKRSMKVSVPSFREDVKRDVDIIEEIARIYGYEKIPSTVPHIVGNTAIKDFTGLFEDKIGRTLTRLGLNEIITYALISRTNMKKLGLREEDAIAIANPLSVDQEIMRPSLLPGMLGAISHNLNRKAKRLSLFEIGKIYKEKGNSYAEENVLSVGLSGVNKEGWRVQRKEFDFFDLKGIFEKLLEKFGITENVMFKKGNPTGLAKNASAILEYDGKVVAYLGEVEKEACDKFGIEKKVFYGELSIESLLGKAKLDKRYAPYGRYPSITRDISLVLDRGTTSHEITAIVKEVGKALVKRVTLVDSYKGEQIPEGKRALLYRIEYRSDEKTLEDAEVEKIHTEIKKTLTEKLNVSFR